MASLLGQLVYTSFPKVGFKVLTSAQVPAEIQQAFLQQVVYRHWDVYNPPKPGHRAAYLHQVTQEHSLFGWLYNDGLDDKGRSHVPYFVCYYLVEQLSTAQLENIFTFLHKGPVALVERQSLPVALETIVASDLWSYPPTRTGVAIPAEIRELSRVSLEQQQLLDLFIPVRDGDIAPTGMQKTRQREADGAVGATGAQVSLRSEAVEQVKPFDEAEVSTETQTPEFAESAPSQDERRSQMTKIALLIGVSDYGSGFNALPRAQKDVEAMQQVLQHSEIGNFAEVRKLINPDRQVMEEAIETLLSDRQSSNLVLLYFSGRGIKDDNGKLYLGTCITRKDRQKKLVKTSTVPASFLQEAMNESSPTQQVVILDCCFGGTSTKPDKKGVSAAYLRSTDWLNQDNGLVDIAHQLGGEGRVILTASTSTQHFLGQDELGPSVYTRYLVEGLETGAADLDSNGMVSIQELHEYSRRRVQIAVPAMQPEIYGTENDGQISLAKAPIDNPRRRYRQEVERYANRGEISIVGRSILDVLRDTLGLLPEEATAIEAGVLEPYLEYQKKLQQYVQEFVEATHHESSIGNDTRNKLKGFQQNLGLTDADIAPVEAQVSRQKEQTQSSDAATESTSSTGVWRYAPPDPIALQGEAVNTLKQPGEAMTASKAATLAPVKANTNSWNRSVRSDSVPAPAKYGRVAIRPWLLIGTGIFAILAVIGVIYGLPRLRSTSPPPASLPELQPTLIPERRLPSVSTPVPPAPLESAPTSTPSSRPTSAPESPSTPLSESSSEPSPTSTPQRSSSPTEASTPSPKRTSGVSTPRPTSTSKPAPTKSRQTSRSKPRQKSVPKPSTSTPEPATTPAVRSPQTPSSEPPQESESVPEPSTSVSEPPQDSVSEPSTSVSEPPQDSVPEPPQESESAPEPPPTSWSDPPPTSAPGSEP